MQQVSASDEDVRQAQKFRESCTELFEELGQVIVGQRQVIEEVLIAMFSRGHCLLEGVPGLAKTLLIRTLAQALHLKFHRIQFTPDLMPADIIGTDILREDRATGQRQFVFVHGPLFANIVLADEINRTPPKTQAALLEAMQEHRVTASGKEFTLSEPFLVLATQNPIEQEGTYPLPEAQLDRFLIRLRIGYPGFEDEGQMLLNLQRVHPIETIGQVVDGSRLPQLQRLVWEVHIDDTVRNYIVRLVQATRTHPDLALGASPRGSIALFKSGQAWAALHGRSFVLPDDVKTLAVTTLAHRLIIRPESALRNRTAEQVMEELLERVDLDIGEM